MQKAKLLLNKIDGIIDSNVMSKYEELSKALTEYFQYGYESGGFEKCELLNQFLNKFYYEYCPEVDLLSCSYILESVPLIFDVNEDAVRNAIYHLQEVMENNKLGLVDGITLEEAKLILEWNVQNARRGLDCNFQNNNNCTLYENVLNSSLNGSCGLAQAYTMHPLIEAGLEVTVNNACFFPNSSSKHAFGTVKIPIKENNFVRNREYLVDVSYRQFFSTFYCHYGRYYLDDSPFAGYYVCQTEEGKAFATCLLKNGYIELAPETAKIYGEGFACESLRLNTLDKQKEIQEISGRLYLEAIYSKQTELDYTKEEIEESGLNFTIPGLNDNRIL